MPSSFVDKSRKPDEKSLAEALGQAKRHWDAILDHAANECHGVTREWKFYGEMHGWQLKLMHGKRNLLYMLAHEGGFTAALALKEKAVEMVRASELPPALLRQIEGAKVYPEGRPVRVEVRGKAGADVVRRLLAIKLATRSRSRRIYPVLSRRQS